MKIIDGNGRSMSSEVGRWVFLVLLGVFLLAALLAVFG